MVGLQKEVANCFSIAVPVVVFVVIIYFCISRNIDADQLENALVEKVFIDPRLNASEQLGPEKCRNFFSAFLFRSRRHDSCQQFAGLFIKLDVQCASSKLDILGGTASSFLSCHWNYLSRKSFVAKKLRQHAASLAAKQVYLLRS